MKKVIDDAVKAADARWAADQDTAQDAAQDVAQDATTTTDLINGTEGLDIRAENMEDADAGGV
ncbi:MAG: hypothetical protein Q9225_005240 [Loekoesia sp. 1 TL-2023]